jgi:hypothetical protein
LHLAAGPENPELEGQAEKAIRKAEHALSLKAIWLDCDVKPNDTSACRGRAPS